MPANSHRWIRVPLPSVDSLVLFDGVCDGVGDDGILRLSLDHILFSLNSPLSRSAPSPVVPRKRERKFDAAALFPSVVLFILSCCHTHLSIRARHSRPSAGPSTSTVSRSQDMQDASPSSQATSPVAATEDDDDAVHSTRSGKRRAL